MAEEKLEELAASFGLFNDWEDKYRYLIDLGRRVPSMDNALKTEENMVRGCTSRVWLVAGWGNAADGQQVFRFEAASDAQIVQGLIYVLVLAYQGKTPEQIETVDINKVFENLGLDRHLSPNRRNGFFAMVERIKILSEGQRV